MEYKLLNTVNGPCIVGDDEVIFFNQHQQMLDYVDEDPEFLSKAKKFVTDGLVAAATDLARSVYEPVVGGDLTPSVYGHVSALRSLMDFELRFLPTINNH